ncbi:hypothetical protein LAZ67_8000925 [Cordylochernes scorpioides]|uniref:Uncharacterized protein n=1 Tax=Cordylochernes scorpioides TaxID=51811 RepID=A0ABY6KQK5_9ARAC|nr:hypothetical protein LAZ67_8000925 [Cordylochernes scorpioides]
MLEMTRTDPEWKDKIITGDETWVYGYDSETKRQSAEWRGQGEPRPKKSRILKSRNKVLLVAYWITRAFITSIFLQAKQLLSFSSFIFITMDRKKVCKKSSAKKKMMSIELKREIIEKHEQGVRVVD